MTSLWIDLNKIIDAISYIDALQNQIDSKRSTEQRAEQKLETTMAINTRPAPGPTGDSFYKLLKMILGTNIGDLIYAQIPGTYLGVVKNYLHQLIAAYADWENHGYANIPRTSSVTLYIKKIEDTLKHTIYENYMPLWWEIAYAHNPPIGDQFAYGPITDAHNIVSMMKTASENLSDDIKKISISIQNGYHYGNSENIINALTKMVHFTGGVIPQTLEQYRQGLNILFDAAVQGKDLGNSIKTSLAPYPYNKGADLHSENEQHRYGIVRNYCSQYQPKLDEYYNSAWNTLAAANDSLVDQAKQLHFGADTAVNPGKDFSSRSIAGLDPNSLSYHQQNTRNPSKIDAPIKDSSNAHRTDNSPQYGAHDYLNPHPSHNNHNLSLPGNNNPVSLNKPPTGKLSHSSNGGIDKYNDPLWGIPAVPNPGIKNRIKLPSRPNYGINPFTRGGNTMPYNLMGAPNGLHRTKSIQGNSYGKNYGNSLVKPQIAIEHDLNHKILGQHIIGVHKPPPPKPEHVPHNSKPL